MYAVYHGPKGLRAIAERVHGSPATLARGARAARACRSTHERFFDTLRVDGNVSDVDALADGRRGARGSTCAAVRRRRVTHRARRDDDRRRTSTTLLDVFARGRRAPAPRRARRGRRRAVRRALRAHERVPHAPGLQHAPLRDGDAALHAQARGADLSLDALDDPARLVHDEAERDRRDDAGDLARVRDGCTRSRRPSRPQGYQRDLHAASSRCSPRSPASPRCRCSRTPARRASTRACW